MVTSRASLLARACALFLIVAAASATTADQCGRDLVIKFNGTCTEVDCKNLQSPAIVNWLFFEECVLYPVSPIFSGAVFVLVIVYALYLLGTTADDYFCPVLECITDSLKLSPNLAGVTFLSFGNGAPDVFTQLASFVGGSGTGEIGLGEIVGAGIFVTTIVVAAVGFAVIGSPFEKLKRRPFVRDVLFYALGVAYLMWVTRDGNVTRGEAVGFLAIYGLFVAVVFVGRKVYLFQKKKRGELEEGLVDVTTTEAAERAQSEPYRALVNPQGPDEKRDRAHSMSNHARHMLHMTGLDDEVSDTVEKDELDNGSDLAMFTPTIKAMSEEYNETSSLLWRIVFWIDIPFTAMRKLTVPQVSPADKYDRGCLVVSPILGLLLLILACLPTLSSPLFGAPAYAVALPVGATFSAVIFFATRSGRPTSRAAQIPVLVFSFVMAVVWVMMIANELVGQLEAIGLAWGISPSMLGITVLAWGNSVGDLVADTAIARAGHPSMAVAGTYAGPFFNMMVGIGAALCIKTFQSPDGIHYVKFEGSLIIKLGILLASLLFACAAVSLSGFVLRRWICIAMLAIYVAFLAYSICTELHIAA